MLGLLFSLRMGIGLMLVMTGFFVMLMLVHHRFIGMVIAGGLAGIAELVASAHAELDREGGGRRRDLEVRHRSHAGIIPVRRGLVAEVGFHAQGELRQDAEHEGGSQAILVGVAVLPLEVSDEVSAARSGQMIVFQEQEVLAVMSVGGTDREEGGKSEK